MVAADGLSPPNACHHRQWLVFLTFVAIKWSVWGELNSLPPSSKLGRLPMTIHTDKIGGTSGS